MGAVSNRRSIAGKKGFYVSAKTTQTESHLFPGRSRCAICSRRGGFYRLATRADRNEERQERRLEKDRVTRAGRASISVARGWTMAGRSQLFAPLSKRIRWTKLRVHR